MPNAVDVLKAAQAVIDNSPADARRIILEAGDLAGTREDLLQIRQLYARSIYKDEDLLAPQKYEKALAVLERDCNLADSNDGETLGLAGAIYKRLWDHTGQRTHLERSLTYYANGLAVTPDEDGWLAVNTAFVADLLGVQEGRAGGEGAAARKARRFAEADDVRRNVLAKLEAAGPPEKKSPWYWHASRAEAAFGLGDFPAAAAELAAGNASLAQWPPSPAQQETTARQLTALAHLRFEGTPRYATASRLIQDAFQISDHAVTALFGGKIGVALSGGGFRASLFHIGVLAKLAELDLLRHVEVISCVSGGSIIGAFYYLELKKLLERGTTSRADYVRMVAAIEEKFLAGVQKNVRTRIAASPWKGVKMALWSGYSRSDVIGELYQEHFYDHIAEQGEEPARVMSDLKVTPAECGSAQRFNPKYDNWRLGAKVPMLVLNATTMNTGHNWQFTATWMGESPQAISETIDAIPRYRRMWYSQAPKKHREIPIGRAVGASACVPALFEPIVLRDLYPDRTIRLVDGGVHDNQGLASLLEQNCRVMLLSDASGQMQEQPSPKGSIGGSLGGSNGILQARVREAQFDQLSALRRAGAIQGAMFIHLTKDLEADPVSWVGEPPKPPAPRPPTTSYGIDRDIQRKLAAVRTDLDSFSDAEAYALMTSGYRMTEHSLLVDQCLPSLPLTGKREPWRFLAVEEAMTRVEDAPDEGTRRDTARMRELLSVSHELAGRIWRQLPSLKALKVVLTIAAVVGVAAVLWNNRSTALPNFGVIVAVVGAVLLVRPILGWLDRRGKYHKRLGEFALGAAVAVVGWPVAWLHLLVFDRMFLEHGKWTDRRKPAAGTIAPPGPRIPITDPPAAARAGGGAVAPAREEPPRVEG